MYAEKGRTYQAEVEDSKQPSHQSRLLDAVSAVRSVSLKVSDILNTLQGNPRPLNGADQTPEPAGQPALATVLENVPGDIQDACEKLHALLSELRATLRI